jgi:DnaJ domain
MAPGSDPYTVLGLPRDATAGQIAQARRRLSREFHPDVNPAPGAAARFDEIQQAYQQLAGARPERDPARDDRARDDSARDDPARDDRGRARVVRDPGGGYGFATEASPGLFIQPTRVDFGRLTPARPSADAKITLAWTGAPPSRLESTPGSGWWASLGSEQPATSCIVFYLRAHAHAGIPGGRQQAQFAVIFDDATLTVQLTAEIQGEFPPGLQPDFTPLPQLGAGGRLSIVSAELQAWLVVILALVVVLLAISLSS